MMFYEKGYEKRKATHQEMLKSKFYREKASDTIRVVGKEEACVECQELGI